MGPSLKLTMEVKHRSHAVELIDKFEKEILATQTLPEGYSTSIWSSIDTLTRVTIIIPIETALAMEHFGDYGLSQKTTLVISDRNTGKDIKIDNFPTHFSFTNNVRRFENGDNKKDIQ